MTKVYTAQKFKNIIKKLYPDAKFTTGGTHYHYVSFHFEVDNQWYYLSTSDDRSTHDRNSGILRTATGPKDYTGGSNNWFEFSSIEHTLHNVVVHDQRRHS